MRQVRMSSWFGFSSAARSRASLFCRRSERAPARVAVRAAAFTAVESLERRTLMAFSALVNFQPAASPTPAGYVADAGLVYGDRGNGFSYGWDAVNTAGLRDRNHGTSP